ncbi:hypothetical protein GZH46_02358, partial [Fragariocoptes setiger]
RRVLQEYYGLNPFHESILRSDFKAEKSPKSNSRRSSNFGNSNLNNFLIQRSLRYLHVEGLDSHVALLAALERKTDKQTDNDDDGDNLGSRWHYKAKCNKSNASLPLVNHSLIGCAQAHQHLDRTSRAHGAYRVVGWNSENHQCKQASSQAPMMSQRLSDYFLLVLVTLSLMMSAMSVSASVSSPRYQQHTNLRPQAAIADEFAYSQVANSKRQTITRSYNRPSPETLSSPSLVRQSSGSSSGSNSASSLGAPSKHSSNNNNATNQQYQHIISLHEAPFSGSSSVAQASSNHEQAQLDITGTTTHAGATTNNAIYRDYSLIELSVRTSAERAYVEQLHANVTRDALRTDAYSYGDIDFWAFRSVAPSGGNPVAAHRAQPTGSSTGGATASSSAGKVNEQQQQLQQEEQVDILVSARSKSAVLAQLDARRIKYRIKLDDVQAKVDEQSGQLEARNEWTRHSGNDTMFFEQYQRLAEISQYLDSLVERNREIAAVQIIGRSSQGRYLRVLKLGYRAGTGPSTGAGASTSVSAAGSEIRKPAIWLDGGTHAREWISPATLLYIAHRLTDNHQRCQLAKHFKSNDAQNNNNTQRSDVVSAAAQASLIDFASANGSRTARNANVQPPTTGTNVDARENLFDNLVSSLDCNEQVEQMLHKYDFYLMPVLNPDGYEYSHTHNRLWRKTRSVSSHPLYRHFCLGADPNRNYDARHLSSGSSSHPCSQTYAGTVAFTEPETRHQSNFVYSLRGSMKMFISLHSYSQMILLPYSHSLHLPDDYADLERVGLAGARAIEESGYGTRYKVGASASILYTASGTASDWAYEKAHIKYSYTIELRDTGTHGFLLPRSQIIPTGQETFNGLVAMIETMEKIEANNQQRQQQQVSARSPPADVADDVGVDDDASASTLDAAPGEPLLEPTANHDIDSNDTQTSQTTNENEHKYSHHHHHHPVSEAPEVLRDIELVVGDTYVREQHPREPSRELESVEAAKDQSAPLSSEYRREPLDAPEQEQQQKIRIPSRSASRLDKAKTNSATSKVAKSTHHIMKLISSLVLAAAIISSSSFINSDYRYVQYVKRTLMIYWIKPYVYDWTKLYYDPTIIRYLNNNDDQHDISIQASSPSDCYLEIMQDRHHCDSCDMLLAFTNQQPVEVLYEVPVDFAHQRWTTSHEPYVLDGQLNRQFIAEWKVKREINSLAALLNFYLTPHGQINDTRVTISSSSLSSPPLSGQVCMMSTNIGPPCQSLQCLAKQQQQARRHNSNDDDALFRRRNHGLAGSSWFVSWENCEHDTKKHSRMLYDIDSIYWLPYMGEFTLSSWLVVTQSHPFNCNRATHNSYWQEVMLQAPSTTALMVQIHGHSRVKLLHNQNSNFRCHSTIIKFDLSPNQIPLLLIYTVFILSVVLFMLLVLLLFWPTCCCWDKDATTDATTGLDTDDAVTDVADDADDDVKILLLLA